MQLLHYFLQALILFEGSQLLVKYCTLIGETWHHIESACWVLYVYHRCYPPVEQHIWAGQACVVDSLHSGLHVFESALHYEIGGPHIIHTVLADLFSVIQQVIWATYKAAFPLIKLVYHHRILPSYTACWGDFRQRNHRLRWIDLIGKVWHLLAISTLLPQLFRHFIIPVVHINVKYLQKYPI